MDSTARTMNAPTARPNRRRLRPDASKKTGEFAIDVTLSRYGRTLNSAIARPESGHCDDKAFMRGQQPRSGRKTGAKRSLCVVLACERTISPLGALPCNVSGRGAVR